MGDYHCEADVHYRFGNIRNIHYGETVCSYTIYHPKLMEPARGEVIITGDKNQIYKLVNHWNKKNRLQNSQWYYEAP